MMSLLMDTQTNRFWASVDFLATGEIVLHIPEECELPIRVLVSRGGRSTEYEPNSSEKPNNCEYAENPSGDVWECGCFLDTYCEYQIYDRNPDGTINIVECGYEPKDELQTERSE